MFSPTRESRSAPVRRGFTQLDVVSIPPGALRFTCSTATRCAAQQKGARREFTRRAPRTSCPVSAASAASAPAAARRTAAARGSATARVATGVTAGVTAATAGRAAVAAPARPPAATGGRAAARAAPPGPPPGSRPAAVRRPHQHDDEGDHHDRDHCPEENPHRPHVLPSPEADPRSMFLTPAADPGVKGGCPGARGAKADLSNFRGFYRGNGP